MMDERTKENIATAIAVGIAAGALWFFTRQYIVPEVKKRIK